MVSASRGRWLPISRHAKELIEHGTEHLERGSEKDLKFSLIHIDNSIEIMLKEHLRYSKGKSLREIEQKSFNELLNSCEDINSIRNNKGHFLAFHDIRNAVYHVGTFVPSREDVESALSFAKMLFNDLHPEYELPKIKIQLPSVKTIQTISQIFGPTRHITELSLLKGFSRFFRDKHYKVEIETILPGGIRVDLLAQKDKELIICEFKARRERMFVGLTAIYQLMHFAHELRRIYPPEKRIQAWLITNARFTRRVKEVATREKIRLIDRESIKKFWSPKTLARK